MDEQQIEQTAPEAAPVEQQEAPAPEAKPKKPKAPRNDFVTFRSVEKENALWDLLIAGDTLRGAWDAAHERVIWTVPADKVERLKAHIQVQQGRIAAVSA